MAVWFKHSLLICVWMAVAIACGPSAEELNREDEAGLTPLIRSAARGDVSTARRQIDRGAAVNVTTKADGLTALKVAAYCGHLQVVQLLVDRGAEVTEKDVEYAVNGGQRHILTYFKATKRLEPQPQSAVERFISVGSMPLEKMKPLCGR